MSFSCGVLFDHGNCDTLVNPGASRGPTASITFLSPETVVTSDRPRVITSKVALERKHRGLHCLEKLLEEYF